MKSPASAARNLETLLSLFTPQYADQCMFCCDDKHPSNLLEKGYIGYLVKHAIRSGVE